MLKHLTLLKIKSMMDIKRVLLQWFMIFLVKILLVVVLKIIIFQTKKLAKEVHKAITRKF